MKRWNKAGRLDARINQFLGRKFAEFPDIGKTEVRREGERLKPDTEGR